jgi:hypothetical protein
LSALYTGRLNLKVIGSLLNTEELDGAI